MPVTRGCVCTISSGVPVGAQIAWLSKSTTGCPVAKTQVAPLTHCALTHGPLAVGGGGNAQPATT
jgi:hypothetical protein